MKTIKEVIDPSNLNEINLDEIRHPRSQNRPRTQRSLTVLPPYTQATIDALSNIDELLSMISIDMEYTSDMTAVHNQHRSNLCHSYSTISAFRQVLIQFLTQLKTDQSLSVTATLIDETIDRINGNEGFSFNRMLTTFLGCVNPRTFLGDEVRQIAMTETVIMRLIHFTAFEVEGWKRILPVRDIFHELGLEV